jgi:hypothetical protein
MTFRGISLFTLIAATAVLALVILAIPKPAAAARSWKDWVNSGYCPPGTCTPLGYWRTSNVKRCRPRPGICRWPN